jgi:type I restriction enzyme S subunit
MNNDVIKSAALEFFCLTGVIPNMENNIRCINSFKDTFADKKFFYPITNPPYGGDKRETSQEAEKRKKIKEYIKEELKDITDEATIHRRQLQLKEIEKLDKIEKKEFDKQKVCLDTCNYSGQRSRINCFAHKYKLKGNDKESCSLILLMDMVDLGGTAVGVLKEGVFFNKTYKDIRKVLVENFNLREVISVPSDQFENTSTKTSIVIFDNVKDKTTSQVVFSEISVEKFDKDVFAEILGDIIITENKDDIKGVVDKVISIATREDILNNPICSLNGKDYNKQEIVCGEDYELVNLGDICEIKRGTKLNKNKDLSENGKYPVYGAGKIIGYSNKINRDSKLNCIICRVGGKTSTKCCKIINENLFLTDAAFSVTSNIELYQFYISYYLEYCYDNIFTSLSNGSCQMTISQSTLNDIQIPIPKTPEKLQYWVDRISTPYDEKNNKLKEIKELEKKVQDRIKEIIETEDCEEKELGSVCKLIDGYDFYNKDLDKKYELGINLPVIKNGNSNTTYANILKKYDKYICKKNDILICTMGTICIKINLFDKAYHSHHIYRLELISNVNMMYIYYYVNMMMSEIKKLSNGSVVKGISKTNLSKFKIPIPTNPELIQEMEPDFQRIEQLQGEVKEAEELYQQYIKELAEEAIPPELNIKQEVKVNLDVETISDTSSITSMIEEKEEIEEIEIHSSSLRITKVKIPNKKQCKGCDKVVTIKTLNIYDGNNCKKCFDKL